MLMLRLCSSVVMDGNECFHCSCHHFWCSEWCRDVNWNYSAGIKHFCFALLLEWSTNHVEAANLNENPLRCFSLGFTFLLLHPLFTPTNTHIPSEDRNNITWFFCWSVMHNLKICVEIVSWWRLCIFRCYIICSLLLLMARWILLLVHFATNHEIWTKVRCLLTDWYHFQLLT